MKTIKLKKKWLASYESLYRELGLVVNNQTNPSSVIMSEEDSREGRKRLRKALLKDQPYLSKKSADYAIALYLLNLEPAVSKAVKKGWILVNERKA